jgi:hypothetical protein
MFELVRERHRFGAGGERAEVALQERIAVLEANLAEYKALAEHRAHSIKVLKVATVALILVLGLTLGLNSAPAAQLV